MKISQTFKDITTPEDINHTEDQEKLDLFLKIIGETMKADPSRAGNVIKFIPENKNSFIC